MRTQRLFVALALSLLAVGGSAHAGSPNVLDPASFDCSDPEVLAAAENQSVPSGTLAAAFLQAGEAQPLSDGGSTCHLAGSGPFSYCTGTCTKVGTSCSQVVTNLGFSCACKAKVITQP